MVSYRKLQPAYRWTGIYLIAAGLIQIVGSFILGDILKITNTAVYTFAIFLYHFILFMVFLNLTERKITRNILILLFGISTLVMAYLVIHQVPASQLSIKAAVVGSLVYAISAMVYLLDFMFSQTAENPVKSSNFIVLSGILFYFSASGVYFAINEVSKVIDASFFIYINLVLSFFFYSILILAIYMNKKRNLNHDLN